MKFKLLMVTLLFFGLMACNLINYSVMIDNRTSQDFIVVVDNYPKGKLIGGGVDTIIITGSTVRHYQLRWIDENGVKVLHIPIDRTMRKIFIQGQNGQYWFEFIGIEKG